MPCEDALHREVDADVETLFRNAMSPAHVDCDLMGRSIGVSAAHPANSVVVLLNSGSPSSEVLDALRGSGCDPQVVVTVEELLEHLARDPDAIVFLDAASSFEGACAVCARIRELPDPARHTICFTSVERGAEEEARAIEAGADAVWDVVRPRMVRALLARSSGRRSRPGEVDEVASMLRHSTRMRAMARSAERRFRALLDSVLDIIAVVSESGEILIVNPAAQVVLGRIPDTLVGVSLWELVHPEDVSLAREMFDEARTAGVVASPTIVRARHGDESWVALEMTGQSLVDDPAIAGVLICARDVTERMWVGAALQDSERRFREIFENILDGVVQVDERSRSLVLANPAFCRMIGCDRQDIFGLTLLDLFPPEERDALAAVMDEHLTGKRRVSDGLRIKHRDGKLRYVDLGTSRMELSGVRTMITVVRDVTERREAERTREMFLAVVAHELRTPVAVLRNGIEILRSKIGKMPIKDRDTLVTVLSEEVERLTRLVGDALDMGAIQSGSLALRPHWVALAPIVSSVAARVGPQFQASANLHLDAADAFVDPLRFEQVLTNLLDNAWRHCGATTKVDVTLSADGEFARISVQDDGPGFPFEQRDRLFERMFVPNDRPTSGIGIGLWLSRRLVESMGGAITADPGGNGRGACVTFTVPQS